MKAVKRTQVHCTDYRGFCAELRTLVNNALSLDRGERLTTGYWLPSFRMQAVAFSSRKQETRFRVSDLRKASG